VLPIATLSTRVDLRRVIVQRGADRLDHGGIRHTSAQHLGRSVSADRPSIAAVTEELYARAPEDVVEPSLQRIALLLDLMGQPQHSAPVITVAGTNGKTSTARMIDTLVRALGLRCGLTTSPHLQSVAERIQIDGRPLPDEEFVDLYGQVAPLAVLADEHLAAAGERPLTFFEVLTALAFAAFADAPVDVMVLEVGMGGAWDATNVADAAVAVITPIAIDHAEYLGDTLPEIAGEKAGVIKPGCVAVLMHQQPEAAEVVLRRCADTGVQVAREGMEFGVLGRAVAVGGQSVGLQGLRGRYDEVFLPLFGAHQAANAAAALAAVEALTGSGEPLADDVVREAFAAVESPGRLEVLRRGPSVLVDAAHNPAGAAALAEALAESFGFVATVGVVGVMADKDAFGILAALEPALDHVICTATGSPRALPAADLARVAEEVFGGHRVSVAADLVAALDDAVAWADARSEQGSAGVVVTGSVVTVGAARALLRSAS
jgi:dihydrofolate synthase/folylpolyglutamate synthase